MNTPCRYNKTLVCFPLCLSKKFETLPGVAQVALQMGKHVSKQIQNDLNNVERKTFNYKDLGEMATIGKSKAK